MAVSKCSEPDIRFQENNPNIISGQATVDAETTRADKDEGQKNDAQFDGVRSSLETSAVGRAEVHDRCNDHREAQQKSHQSGEQTKYQGDTSEELNHRRAEPPQNRVYRHSKERHSASYFCPCGDTAGEFGKSVPGHHGAKPDTEHENAEICESFHLMYSGVGGDSEKIGVGVNHAISTKYFLLASRQTVTRKAVSGIARTIPRMPPSAVPQKKMAIMMVTG